MRLDHLLVTRKLFATRQKAKEGIKRGYVLVDGEVITKPAMEVDPSVEVKLTEPERPKGYWKLQAIDSQWNLIKEGDVVLDLGSSSGGFVRYASQKAARVYGIEFSKNFEGELTELEEQLDNVRIFMGDAFTFDLTPLEPVDLILCDLTLEGGSALKAVEHFLPLLKPEGKVLFVLKTGMNKHYKLPDFERAGMKIADKMESQEKKETYYLLSRA
ncbi:MAG: SAM-dependent methyltransferase [Halobacteriota archaeon]